MKNVFLHIGTGKTGTSTIQNSLHESRDKLRSTFSIDYANIAIKSIDHFGEKIIAHYPLVDWIKSRSEKGLKKIGEYIESSDCKTIVFSCENLYHALTREDVEWLAHQLGRFNVYSICYVRRQDLYIESAYRQQVKVGEFKMPFRDFLKRHTDPYFLNEVHANYFRMIEVWKNAFGRDHTIVKPFDRKLFRNGSLLDDFGAILGIDDGHLYSNFKNETNQTLPSELINVIRIYNSCQIIPRSDHQEFVEFLRSNFDFNDENLLEKDDREKVMNNYQECNKALCSEYGISDSWFSNMEFTEKPTNPTRSSTALLAEILYALFCQFHGPSHFTRLKIKAFFLVKDITWLAKRLKSSNGSYQFFKRLRLVLNGSFSPTFYLSKYEDIKKSKADPFVHYENHGKIEKRLPHPNPRPKRKSL